MVTTTRATTTVLSAAVTAVIIASGTSGVLAGMMMPNPAAQVEQIEIEVPLDHYHPAYGAITPDAALAYVIPTFDEENAQPSADDSPIQSSDMQTDPDNDNEEEVYGTVETGAYQRRLETASSMDIAKLESHFKTPMERNFDTLSTPRYMSASFVPAPWPSSYWPIYADGINYRWQGDQPSPSEKYASAFGLNVTTFTETISKSNGIDSQDYRLACVKNDDCAKLNDGSICGIRQGRTSGFCIPGWFGICHAWAPAAILEPEPRCAVKKNATTFQPMDIKALLTQVYDGARVKTIFTGYRFNGPDSPENKDSFGRFNDPTRRDLDPAFFHIAMANIMGKFNQSFVVDVTAGSEVWNQPVRDYQVVEMKPLTLAEGAKTYFNVDAYPFNRAAVTLAYVNTKFRWIVEAVENGPLVETGKVEGYTTTGDYTYLLELDAQKNIIGGEWVGDSRTNHPDFLWFPSGRPDNSTVTDVGLSYKNVLELLDASVKCVDLDTIPAPTPAPSPMPSPSPSPAPISTPSASDQCSTPAWGSCGDRNSLRCCPSGQYCQAWDSWTYYCINIPQKCSQQFTNIDFFGNDIGAAYALKPEDCCEACARTSGCKAYTFVNENSWGSPACYLKSSGAGRTIVAGAVSGVLG